MAYLRTTTKLPSGNTSRYHVIGGPNGILNIYAGEHISHPRMRELLQKGTEDQIIGELEEKLELNDEEAKYVSEMLFYEKETGEWEKPFEWEDGQNKHY